jgi:hypothetical protein
MLRLLTLALVALPLAAQQPPEPTAALEAMKKLRFWTGKWSGTATVQMGPQKHSSTIDETIEYKLGGFVLHVQGLGKESGRVIHDALGIVTWDDAKKQYRFQSWRMPGGVMVDTELKLTGEKSVQWGFSQGPMQLRFTMTINEKGEWYEYGEGSRDGATWQRFHEMTLRRVD